MKDALFIEEVLTLNKPRLVVVPDSLREAINAKLDAAFKICPGAAPDRDVFYEQLLAYFDEYGALPDFSLERSK